MTTAITLRPTSVPWPGVLLVRLLRGCGILVALFGVLVALSWYTHWVTPIRIGAGLPAMKLNAAVCFILCGAALALMTSSRKMLAMILSGVAVAIVVATLENDQDLSAVLQASLAGRAEVVIARTLKSARHGLQEQTFAALVIDPGLPDGSGLALLDQIERMALPPPVVILSVTEMPRAIRQRVAACFVKSRVSESALAHAILAVIHDSAEPIAIDHLEA